MATRPAISPVIDAYLHNPTEADQIAESLKGINSQKEFTDLFLRSASSQQYNLTISGKGKHSIHRASFAYTLNNAEFKQNSNDRYAIDFYESVNLLKNLKLNMGLNYVILNNKNNGLSYSNLASLYPYQQIIDANGDYIDQPRSFYYADKEGFVSQVYPYKWNYNLMQEYENKNNKSVSHNVNVNFGLNYNLFNGFDINIGYQYESANTNTDVLYNEETN